MTLWRLEKLLEAGYRELTASALAQWGGDLHVMVAAGLAGIGDELAERVFL